MITLKVDEKVRLTAVAVDKYSNVVEDAAGTLVWSVDASSVSIGQDGWLVAGTVAGDSNVSAKLTLAAGSELSNSELIRVAPGDVMGVEIKVAEGPVPVA